MKRAFLLVSMASILSFAGSGWAAVFNVADDTQLRNALTSAAGNSDNDTINIAAGIYNTSGSTFSYTPSVVPPEENYSLTITGSGAGNTILDGGNSDQVMNINTTGLPDDANAEITVMGITFQNGNAIGVDGGGIYVATNSSNITIEDCQFKDNTTSNIAGGAYCGTFTGTVAFTKNVFDGNSAGPSCGGTYGGSTLGTLTFTNNIFNGNSADWYGGVYSYTSSGIMRFTSNIFIGNTATSADGAGVGSYTTSGTTIFTNNIFNGNTGNQRGGGAYSYSSNGIITFTNNTFSGNTTGPVVGDGGGLYISLNEDSATGNIYNNIVWNNTTSGNGNDIYVDDDNDGNGTGATVNLYYNDINDYYINDGDNLSEGNNINTNPLFMDDSDPDPANWDLHITMSSPCKDAGTAAAPELPTTDVDGQPRTIGSAPDIGADEFSPTPSTPVLIGGGGGGGGCSMSNPEGRINIGHQVILAGIFALGLLVWRERRRR